MADVNILIVRTHLMSRKKQTIVAILSVTLGIAMFILLTSFMKGMNNFFQDITLSAIPDIHLFNDIKSQQASSVAVRYAGGSNRMVVVRHPKPVLVRKDLKNGRAIVEDLRKRIDVLTVSPIVSAQVLFDYGPVQLGATIEGVDIKEEMKMFNLRDKIVAGSPLHLLSSSNGILLGSRLAKKLNVTVDDWITVTAGSGKQSRFRVVGLFQFGISTVDEIRAYVLLSDMQQLLGKGPDYLTNIRIKLKNSAKAAAFAKIFEQRYGYRADDWETMNASMKAGNFIRDVFTSVLTFTLLIVAGIGIYNIMNMIIIGKLKDIAILKAQGFAKKDILQIFLYQSLAVGIVGAVFGLALGFALSYGLSKVPWPEDEWVVIKNFPVDFSGRYYIMGAAYALITTFLAGLMPALKAAKVDPVSILRG